MEEAHDKQSRERVELLGYVIEFNFASGSASVFETARCLLFLMNLHWNRSARPYLDGHR